MKIWLSKNSEIPVREQIVTQIALGIVSGDLRVGERLPSTREIARRFGVHSNTVGFAYQKLSEQGLIEFRKGSGFFVSENKTKDFDGKFKLDQLIAEFFQSAQTLGFSVAEIQKHLQKWLDIQPPERFTLIESDAKLREILVEEISQATNFPVTSAGLEEFEKKLFKTNAIFVAMIDEKAKIQTILPPDKTCLFLKARSVPESMTGETRPSADDLIAIVSGWEKFLLWAKTFLVAANVESDSIILRSTGEADWPKGLKNARMIICDALAARKFEGDQRARVFRVIADDSLDELREIVKD
ncbi:MAG TPA: GntR family transcriptional regulator [Pyrinomonadaceae bacterium]|jgi:GntR family transcriptional regulator